MSVPDPHPDELLERPTCGTTFKSISSCRTGRSRPRTAHREESRDDDTPQLGAGPAISGEADSSEASIRMLKAKLNVAQEEVQRLSGLLREKVVPLCEG
jgi:hypothetical protein